MKADPDPPHLWPLLRSTVQPRPPAFLVHKPRARAPLQPLLWLLVALMPVLMANPLLAQVLRPQQEAKVQAWIGGLPAASGLKVGDISIRPDEIRVHIEATDHVWGKLRLLPVGARESPAARLPSFDAVWEGPPPPPALLAWLAHLGETDQGGWWSEGSAKPPAQAAAQRPTAPWPVVVLGPVWMLLAFGMLASGLLVHRRQLQPRAVGITVGAAVLSVVLWRSGHVIPGGMQALSSAGPASPQALRALWHWQLGGDLAGWRLLASLWTGTLCSGALVAAWNATLQRSLALYSVVGCALLLLLAATWGPVALPVLAGAIWLGLGTWRSASARLAAVCGALLLAGSGPVGVTLACTAGVARWLRRAQRTRLPA